MEDFMTNRIVLATMLLVVGVLGAKADTSVWVNTTKHARSDAVLQADTAYCTQTAGTSYEGAPPPAPFRRCMQTRGWRFQRWNREEPTSGGPSDPIWQTCPFRSDC
jgi:hypothetical protein